MFFSQWPWRELLQAHSRQTNGVGQTVFAFYVAFTVMAASTRHTPWRLSSQRMVNTPDMMHAALLPALCVLLLLLLLLGQ